MPADAFCSNEYVEELGRLEGVKDNMTGGGQPVELAVELDRIAFCTRCWSRAFFSGLRPPPLARRGLALGWGRAWPL